MKNLDIKPKEIVKTKSINKVIPSRKVRMGSALLDQPLQSIETAQIDPFLLIHHWEGEVKQGKSQDEAGVGPHPHRGFAPVTFVFQGEVDHQDSIGNKQTVKAGGTQWMHSGKGIIHSERPSNYMLENGGTNEIIQFWVNSPAKHKLEDPYYLPISKEETPEIEKAGSILAVVAGAFEGVNGPAKTYSPQTLLRATVKKDAQFSFNIPAHFNTLIYLLDGAIEVNGRAVKAKDLIWFKNDGESIEIKGLEATRFIVLSGEPINEPVKMHGPFVMNTQLEIQEAYNDFHEGKMGALVEEFK